MCPCRAVSACDTVEVAWSSDIDFGSLPDWLAAAGTAAATLILAFGWRRDNRLRRQDAERQAATAIRQSILEIERLHDDFDSFDGLSTANRRELRRLVREIQAQCALLPEPFADRLFKVSTFFDDTGIETFHGDRARRIA